MKIVSIVENSTNCGLKTVHGLSLYIETMSHKILFDVGPDATFIDNAASLGIDLTQVDTVIISHGHRDHGGGLQQFVDINSRAIIYIQKRAFLPHFSHRPTAVANIGLDQKFLSHPQVTIIDGDYRIDEELELFTLQGDLKLVSGANSSLYECDNPDKFEHEQNLFISEQPLSQALIMGCGHTGVVNIMERVAEKKPNICVGGFHLTNPSAGRDEPREKLDAIVDELTRYDNTQFYTCHCTGERVFEYLRSKMKNISYLSAGMSIDL